MPKFLSHLCSDVITHVFSFLLFDVSKMKKKQKIQLLMIAVKTSFPIFKNSFIKISKPFCIEYNNSKWKSQILFNKFENWIIKYNVDFDPFLNSKGKKIRFEKYSAFSSIPPQPCQIETLYVSTLEIEPNFSIIKDWVKWILHYPIPNIHFDVDDCYIPEFLTSVKYHWNKITLELINDEQFIVAMIGKNCLQTCSILHFYDHDVCTFPSLGQKFNVYMIDEIYECMFEKIQENCYFVIKEPWKEKKIIDMRNWIISDKCCGIKGKSMERNKKKQRDVYKKVSFYIQTIDHWCYYYKTKKDLLFMKYKI